MKTHIKTKVALLVALCSIQQVEASQLLATRTYNAVGHLTTQGDSAGQMTDYTYNTQGQLQTTKDPDGHVTTNTYNDHGLMTQQVATGSNTPTVTLQRTYDTGNDALLTSSVQNGTSSQTTTLTRNLVGAISSKQFPNGKRQTYTYTPDGRIQTFTNIAGQQTVYAYNTMHELQSVKLNGDTTTYDYTPFGQVHASTNQARGINTTWSYDDYNGIANITTKKGNTTLQNTTYQYDIDGNIQSESLNDGTAFHYAYNPLNELTSYQCTGTSCPKDAQGNTITARTYTYTLNRGIQTLATNGKAPVTYTYWPNHPDELEKIGNGGTYQYDASGNMTTDANGDTLTYNALNQMTSMRMNKGPKELFTYNPDGKVAQEGTDPSNMVALYYSIGKHPTITAKTQGSATDTYALGINRIAQYYSANTAQDASPTAQYYVTNQHGDITQVINGQGTVSDHYVYTPFGQSTDIAAQAKQASPASFNTNTFEYIGQSLNHNTGVMMMGGYRAYNPNVGVFLKRDSYSPFVSNRTFNGFDYAAGNPVLMVDPSGHASFLEDAFEDLAIVATGVIEEVATGGAATPTLVAEDAAILGGEAAAAGGEAAAAAGSAGSLDGSASAGEVMGIGSLDGSAAGTGEAAAADGVEAAASGGAMKSFFKWGSVFALAGAFSSTLASIHDFKNHQVKAGLWNIGLGAGLGFLLGGFSGAAEAATYTRTSQALGFAAFIAPTMATQYIPNPFARTSNNPNQPGPSPNTNHNHYGPNGPSCSGNHNHYGPCSPTG